MIKYLLLPILFVLFLSFQEVKSQTNYGYNTFPGDTIHLTLPNPPSFGYYQWQVSYDSSMTWVDLTGDTSSTLNYIQSNTFYGEIRYRNKYKFNQSDTCTFYSDTIKIYVGTNFYDLKYSYFRNGGRLYYIDSVNHIAYVSSDEFLSGSYQFGCRGTAFPTGNSIGLGKVNTQIIVDTCSESSAALACHNFIGNGYSDWYLPSFYEAREISIVLDVWDYWTSSTQSYFDSNFYNNSAWYQRKGNVLPSLYDKINFFFVLPVRDYNIHLDSTRKIEIYYYIQDNANACNHIKISKDTITQTTNIFSFEGFQNDSLTYVWNFNEGNILSGSIQGPYNVQFSNQIIQQISLRIFENNVQIFPTLYSQKFQPANFHVPIDLQIGKLSYGTIEWGDFNNDGFPDILLTGSGKTEIYKNNGDDSFTKLLITLPSLDFSIGKWQDFDNDNLIDFFITGIDTTSNILFAGLYKNNGNEIFTNMNFNFSGIYNGDIEWFDYDNDGKSDILISGIDSSGNPSTILYKNEVDSFQVISTIIPHLKNSGISSADFNKDGYVDLVIQGKTDDTTRIVLMYKNNEGVFENYNVPLLNVSHGDFCWVDYDNDGFLDLLLFGMKKDPIFGPNSADYDKVASLNLYKNNNGQSFTLFNNFTEDFLNSSKGNGYWGGNCDWGDYDNDGFTDFYINGFRAGLKIYTVGINGGGTPGFLIPPASLLRIFKNRYGVFFQDIKIDFPYFMSMSSFLWMHLGNFETQKLSLIDYNNDGKIDVLRSGARTHALGKVYLYKNLIVNTNQPPTQPMPKSEFLSENSIVFKWYNAIDDHTSINSLYYKYYVRDFYNKYYVSKYNKTLINDTTKVLNIDTLQPGVYYWAVKAIDGAKVESNWSNERVFYVPHQTITICEGDSIEIFGSFRKDPGFYVDTFQSSLDSDSIYVTELRTINYTPNMPDEIIGIDSICQGHNGITYIVPPIENATSYMWTLPNGTSGISNSNTIVVDYSTTAVSGIISVKGKNSCGEGALSSLHITVNPLPATVETISGNLDVCIGQNALSYTVLPIANATSYIWTLPTGATGTSTTNSIDVDFSTSANSGYITVKGTNACGEGAISAFPILVKPFPDSAGLISGDQIVCQGQNLVTYTLPTIANAISYDWTLPMGASGSSTSNTIVVDFGTSAVSGEIAVKGINTCGDGTISILPIIVNPLPDSAGTITGNQSVCQGENSVTYSVPPIENATSYFWTLPNGVSGTSSTNSIEIDFGITAVSCNITVKGSNQCGNGTISTLPIIVNLLPASAETISGISTVCQGQNAVTYSVAPIENAISYIWTLPNGASGLSTTNSINVNYSNCTTSGDITVKGINACGFGTNSTKTITVNPLPHAGETIIGPASVCQGQNSVVYYVPTITNATSYLWTLPNGATGSSSTNTIIVDYSTTATSGNITVKGINDCGEGFVSTLPIIVNLIPDSVETISGFSTVCQGQNAVTYTVPTIDNLFYYDWTLPNGATGTSLTNSIIVNFGTSAVSGNISVSGVNYCGNGPVSSKIISVNPLPSTPEPIVGFETVCQGQNSVNYSIPLIPNALSYIWSLPSGMTGTSTTNSINVNFGFTSSSGNITVKGTNGCGMGTTATKAITVNLLPGAPSTISGANTICAGATFVNYSVSEILNATSYTWTLPNGATGTSTTNNINVNYGNNATSGNVTVKGNNSCGDGTIGTKAITVNTIPNAAGIISGPSSVCQGETGVIYSTPSIVNANSYIWNYPNGVTGISTSNSITLNYGNYAVSGNITVKGLNLCGEGSSSILPVNVNPKPVTPNILLNNTILSSDANTGNQWYNENGAIPNETNQELTPTENGTYYVIVTQNDCSSNPSNSILVNNVQVQNFDKNLILISPNPFINQLSIKNQSSEIYQYYMYNGVGQQVLEGTLNTEVILNTSDLTKGLYIIKFVNNLGQVYYKMIKQ